MAHRFLRSIHTWPAPPNWSLRDWSEELNAEVIAASWEAERDFDPTRGVPLDAFVPTASLDPVSESLPAGMGLCPALRKPPGGERCWQRHD